MSDDGESHHGGDAVHDPTANSNDDSEAVAADSAVNRHVDDAGGNGGGVNNHAHRSDKTTNPPQDGRFADVIPSDFKSLQNGGSEDDHDNNNDNNSDQDGNEPTPNKTTSSDSKDPLAGSSYRDFSRIPPNDTGSVASIFKAASAKEPTFPAKLHMILSNPQFEDIVAWMPHGRSWRILKPDVFEDRVLPLFFCHCRLSSFMRQVNGWGFKRIKHGPDYNSYYNELFLRGLPYLVERMRRESVSAKSKGGAVEDEPAPDLYRISEDSPLPNNPTLAEHLQRAAAGNAPPMGMANPMARRQ